MSTLWIVTLIVYFVGVFVTARLIGPSIRSWWRSDTRADRFADDFTVGFLACVWPALLFFVPLAAVGWISRRKDQRERK